MRNEQFEDWSMTKDLEPRYPRLQFRDAAEDVEMEIACIDEGLVSQSRQQGLVIRRAWLDIGCCLADTNEPHDREGRGRHRDGLVDVRSTTITSATEPCFGASYWSISI
jgi:hypothetical protein